MSQKKAYTIIVLTFFCFFISFIFHENIVIWWIFTILGWTGNITLAIELYRRR